MTAEHLGGHLWKTHVDEGVLRYFRPLCVSMIDIGCGPAGNVLMARELGYDAFGIDGDHALQEKYSDLIALHDYTLGPLPLQFGRFELAFSTEFLEHVEERFIPNFMETFKACRYVVCTHALPGETGGHHHVNLKDDQWWINKFSEYGFSYSPNMTADIKRESTMVKNFMRKTGKVFINDRQD